MLKETTKHFSSKISEHTLYTITTTLEEYVENIIIKNRVVGKFEASKLEPERIIEKKFYEIESDHIKTINSIDIKYQPPHQLTPPNILIPYKQTATAIQNAKHSKKYLTFAKDTLIHLSKTLKSNVKN